MLHHRVRVEFPDVAYLSANFCHSCAAPLEFFLGLLLFFVRLHAKMKPPNLNPNALQVAPGINSSTKELMKTGL
jgi:hypothetical protein